MAYEEDEFPVGYDFAGASKPKPKRKMIVIVKPQGFVWELGIRGYGTRGDQYRAIAMLRKQGFNYFVCFKDKQSDYALQIGHADWVRKGDVYIDR